MAYGSVSERWWAVGTPSAPPHAPTTNHKPTRLGLALREERVSRGGIDNLDLDVPYPVPSRAGYGVCKRVCTRVWCEAYPPL